MKKDKTFFDYQNDNDYTQDKKTGEFVNLKTKERITFEIKHINPNCYDSRFCLPHREIGEVKYNMKWIFEYIRELENHLKKRL